MRRFLCLLIILIVCVSIVGCKEGSNKDPGPNKETQSLKGDAENVDSHLLIFGTYEQDNNSNNGKEAIEWIILDKTDDSMLIISKYALDQVKFNETLEDVTWENCTLRTWLNEEFLNMAFTADEQTRILDTAVIAEDNPTHGTDGGNDTVDKLFLLSISEAKKYFDSDAERMCMPTAYTKMRTTVSSENGVEGNCWWGLRSPGDLFQSHIAFVSPHGDIEEGEGYGYGSNVDSEIMTLRPAMWISLN